MERIYLLLRNNRQSGPFTLGELLQHQVLPSDMIWVEGKSTAWTYLSELELTPFAKTAETTDQTNEVKVGDEIERKAEELRQRILSTSPKTYFQNHTPEIETFKSPHRLDDKIEFVDYRKERKLKKSTAMAELLLTFLVVGLLAVGIYKSKTFFGARHDERNSVATELNSNDQHAAQKKSETKQIIKASAIDTAKNEDSLLALQVARQKFSAERRVVTDSARAVQRRALNQQKKKDEVTVQKIVIPNETVKQEEDTPVKTEIVSSVPEIKIGEPVKEKKGFLRGLFKKKKDKGKDE